MNIQVAFDEKVNCVVGRFKGDLTLAAAKKYIREVVEVAKKHPCQRFLNDLREANLVLSVFDIYELPGLVVTEGFDIRWRRAFLMVPTTNLDKIDFFELVASNRGMSVRMFTDYDKAIEWLTTGYVEQP
ncbi:MAG: hypothetical protein ACYSTT_21080 [Planctomycetota bacterium]|jgi:hypothetical protein